MAENDHLVKKRAVLQRKRQFATLDLFLSCTPAAAAAAAAAAAQEQLGNLDVRDGPMCKDDVDDPDEGAQAMAVKWLLHLNYVFVHSTCWRGLSLSHKSFLVRFVWQPVSVTLLQGIEVFAANDLLSTIFWHFLRSNYPNYHLYTST